MLLTPNRPYSDTRRYSARAMHVCRRRQVLSTPDRPLSLFTSQSPTVGGPWPNFLSPEIGISEGSNLIFGDTLISLKHNVNPQLIEPTESDTNTHANMASRE